MAFMIKNKRQGKTSDPYYNLVDQWIRVSKAAATLPASTTQTIFNVDNGNVLVKLLYGEVTTIVQAQANNLSVEAVPDTGTLLELASVLDINADEAGTIYMVEGDGTALVGTVAGGALNAVGTGSFIVAPGVIRIVTSATNTGATKWEIFYIPLEDDAVVITG